MTSLKTFGPPSVCDEDDQEDDECQEEEGGEDEAQRQENVMSLVR